MQRARSMQQTCMVVVCACERKTSNMEDDMDVHAHEKTGDKHLQVAPLLQLHSLGNGRTETHLRLKKKCDENRITKEIFASLCFSRLFLPKPIGGTARGRIFCSSG